MKITQRQSDFLKILLNDENININKISDLLNVSPQTVKQEIQDLKKLFIKYEIEIYINNKNEIILYGHENILKMLKETEDLNEFEIDNQIILLIILQKNYLTLQDIADELYTSRSLVEKHMQKIIKKNQNIYSKRRHGIIFKGSTLLKRNIFINLLFPYFSGINFKKEISKFNEIHFPILNYLNEKIINNTIKIIEEILKIEMYTDESTNKIFLSILLLIYEKENNIQYIKDPIIKEYDKNSKYEIIINNIQKIINLNKDEKNYIIHILENSKKIELNNKENMIKKMSPLITEILEIIKNTVGINLQNDQILIKNFSTHVYTSLIEKIKFQELIDVKNTFKEFKRQYPLAYEMATISAQFIEKKYNISLSQEDIVYFTIHFQSALERSKEKTRKVKTIIICHYGISVSELIKLKLNRLFPELQIKKVLTIQEYKKMKDQIQKEKYDFIITTEKIIEEKIPLIYVTPMLLEQELNKIRKVINCKKINNILTIKVLESKIINTNQKNVKNIIIEGIKYLIENNYVKKEYLNSVLEREKISSTNLNTIAIPHGNPKFVKETKMVILRLKNSIIWNDSKVNIIFLFAASEETVKLNPLLLSTFYKNLSKKEIEEKIQQIIKYDDEKFRRYLSEIINY
ncbi:PTS sugar transporter subunit IIA [Oceanotoga sp. DSM 15011]|jgi:transcriptional antiterminator|uniref:BglG family transcription antiterminator n=1 Tax=Oceanotoga sp. DSM 15011 TaxID=2984951 RepID=UPI0021F41F35|nr:PTS sugar transporter subunit IIA [Oceanotoga sp. DSM 15011]UYO99307.1 PTS sugar transporter subunit IIA [Oceanotoga sp. DSM 15011]